MKKYKFKTKLKEALLIKRQERPVPVSIFMDGEEMQVICLGTGGVKDGEYACLVSPNSNLTGMEQHVIEAVAFDGLDSKERHWISLRPAVYNDAAAFFLENHLMAGIANECVAVSGYADSGNLGVDFIAGDTAIAVKLALAPLEHRTGMYTYVGCPFLSDSSIKKYAEGLQVIKSHYKRIVLLSICQYGMDILMQTENCSESAMKMLQTAVSSGLEFWTARMKFEADGIRLLSYKNMTDRIGFY